MREALTPEMLPIVGSTVDIVVVWNLHTGIVLCVLDDRTDIIWIVDLHSAYPAGPIRTRARLVPLNTDREMVVPFHEVMPTLGPMETVRQGLLDGQIVLDLLDYKTNMIWVVNIFAVQPFEPIRSELRQMGYEIAFWRMRRDSRRELREDVPARDDDAMDDGQRVLREDDTMDDAMDDV